MYPGGILANLIRGKRDGNERRRLRRHAGTGLVALIDDGVVDVLDISLAGVRLALAGDVAGDFGRGEVRLRIVKGSLLGTEPDDGNAGASATAVVVARSEHDLRLRFVGMTYPLAHLIVAHIAAVSGISPYIFR
jgi:hypothetical protein